jgi:hypothetical protein
MNASYSNLQILRYSSEFVIPNLSVSAFSVPLYSITQTNFCRTESYPCFYAPYMKPYTEMEAKLHAFSLSTDLIPG